MALAKIACNYSVKNYFKVLINNIIYLGRFPLIAISKVASISIVLQKNTKERVVTIYLNSAVMIHSLM